MRLMISGYYNSASLYCLKFPMTLDPLLSAPQPIPVHAIAALVAMVLGGLQLWGLKGTRNHRTLGYIWVGLMAIVAFSGFFIHVLKLFGPFSPIYLLSVLTLASLWYAIRAARRGYHQAAPPDDGGAVLDGADTCRFLHLLAGPGYVSGGDGRLSRR